MPILNCRRTNTDNRLALKRYLIIRQEIDYPIAIGTPQQRPEGIGVETGILRRPLQGARDIISCETLIQNRPCIFISDFATEKRFDAGVIRVVRVSDSRWVCGEASLLPHPSCHGGELPLHWLTTVGKLFIVHWIRGFGW